MRTINTQECDGTNKKKTTSISVTAYQTKYKKKEDIHNYIKYNINKITDWKVMSKNNLEIVS